VIAVPGPTPSPAQFQQQQVQNLLGHQAQQPGTTGGMKRKLSAPDVGQPPQKKLATGGGARVDDKGASSQRR